MQKVMPQTYLVGSTTIHWPGIEQFLFDSDNVEFQKDIDQAKVDGLSDAEILCSLYAKLCYKSLTAKHNENISKTRDIKSNIENCFDVGHGSVFEHAQLNFITRNCSRVFTHELVRHRAGFAFSQTSGRYVRSDQLDMVLDDPILQKYGVDQKVAKIADSIEYQYNLVTRELFKNNPNMDFTEKKKITSALRRVLPNGQANDIGWSCNIRALRHVIMVRTNRHAEFEIRHVFNEVYNLVKNQFPLIMYGVKEEIVDGLLEITGLKTQPY